jgi:hypothetical protein
MRSIWGRGHEDKSPAEIRSAFRPLSCFLHLLQSGIFEAPELAADMFSGMPAYLLGLPEIF